ncbi:hypothetical protein P692DRAFT_20824345, partial [Suillus brevipes Sb2]
LIFFVLMDPSLLVFGALHRHDEPILPRWRSQTIPTLANLRFQPLQDEVTSLPTENVRHSAAVRPAVPCSLLWLQPIYAHRLSKFEDHAIASRQANDRHQVQQSVHACPFITMD